MPSQDVIDAMAKSMPEHFQAMAASEQILIRLSLGIMKLIARPLVAQMGITHKTTTPVALLDNACGSGVVTQEVQAVLPDEILQSSSFTCADNSAPLVDLVEKRAAGEKWVNVEAKVLDAMNTGLAENSFTHAAIALALHIIPDPDAVVKDCIRVLKPGGTFGATTFPKSNADIFWFPDMRDALQSLPFDAPFPDPMPMQMHRSGHWDDAAWVEKHLAELGLTNVTVREIPGTYRFANAEEFVTSFSMMLPWVRNTFWSEEVRNAHPVEEVMELLKQHFEAKYNGQGWSIDWLVIYMTGSVPV